MEIKPTGIDGLLEVYPNVYHDERGLFLEVYTPSLQNRLGMSVTFVQDNLSFSKKNVVRGLHLQLPPFAQAKIVSVVKGKVLDVAVDLRKNSKTFGKYFSTILDDEKHNMLVIPEGFAHGFAALSDSYFFYKCSAPYHSKSEIGITWNDPTLNIDWRINSPVVSPKDLQLPTLEEFIRNSVISPKD
jgi:dTDP-4-dehydrorhamnose 3,5-epimerase